MTYGKGSGATARLGGFVRWRAARLGSRVTEGDSEAKATLATLRHAAAAGLDENPAAWGVIFDGFPEDLVGRGDDLNVYERAAFTALSLFAVHQQSAKRPMHVDGVGFGDAIRQLAGRGEKAKAVSRRFTAVATAQSMAETRQHMRGLIQQMRAEGIGLDYGLLARDLVGLEFPDGATGVRLRWARQVHAPARPDSPEPAEAAS